MHYILNQYRHHTCTEDEIRCDVCLWIKFAKREQITKKLHLKTGRTVFLSHENPRNRQSRVVYGDPGTSHSVALPPADLCSQGHLMVRMASPASSIRPGSNLQKGGWVKEGREKEHTGCFFRKVSKAASWNLLIGHKIVILLLLIAREAGKYNLYLFFYVPNKNLRKVDIIEQSVCFCYSWWLSFLKMYM